MHGAELHTYVIPTAAPDFPRCSWEQDRPILRPTKPNRVALPSPPTGEGPLTPEQTGTEAHQWGGWGTSPSQGSQGPLSPGFLGPECYSVSPSACPPSQPLSSHPFHLKPLERQGSLSNR